jgi:hypothetical protein
MYALRENIKVKKIGLSYFEKSLSTVRASLTDDLIKYYEKVTSDLGKGIAKKDKRDKDIQYM